MSVQPLFVFSITRSGSTLVQRVLGSYADVATVSEPWLLMPHVYSQRREGVVSEYTHYLMVEAIEDFCAQLEGGHEEYWREVREHVLRLYASAASDSGVRYFLDKTPPYFLIVDEIMRLFPDARFIFLWRNPLSVVASLIEWDRERWDPARYGENLFEGPAKLVAAYERQHARICAVRYEDLITGGEVHWRRMAEYLELDFDPGSLSRFAEVQLEGRMGDPTGVKRYSQLSTEPLTKWRGRIDNPLRRAWCDRYLLWLGGDRLATMGYDLEGLREELHATPVSWTGSAAGDAGRVLRSLAKEPFRVRARAMVGLGGPSPLRHVLGT